MQPQPPPTPTEETIFKEDDFLARGYDKHMRQARNAIFVVAALHFLVGMFVAYNGPDEERLFMVALVVGISTTFFVLGLWAAKKPYPAILTAVIIYGTLLIGDAIFDPMSIMKGIILKGVIIFYLIRGLKNAKEYKDRSALVPK